MIKRLVYNVVSYFVGMFFISMIFSVIGFFADLFSGNDNQKKIKNFLIHNFDIYLKF